MLYSDWVDSVEVAKTQGDLRSAQRFYHNAFARQPALVMHAMDCARIAWQLRDTGDAAACVLRALDLGESGDAIAEDSVLSSFWLCPKAMAARDAWRRYKAMQLPEVMEELERMFREDQDILKTIDWEKADSPDSLVRRSVWVPVEAQDSAHTARVVEIIRKHGVPSVHQVGLTGNKMIFFAFIHANDPKDITDHVLLLSASVRRGDSPACWYAYVIDRLMVKTSKETMFGTTGYLDPADNTVYMNSVVPQHLDLLREAMGIPRSRKGRSFY